MSNTFFEDQPKQEYQPPKEGQTTPADEKKPKAVTVSFSQYAKWLKCPMSWKLAYIDYLAPFEASINTAFGDAIHEPLQAYLTTLYSEGSVAAEALDVHKMFNEVFTRELGKLKIATESQAKMLDEDGLDELGLITEAKVEEFREDGKNILNEVLSPINRRRHFPSKIYEVVGTELPLVVPMKSGAINFKAYLDIVLRDKNTKKILILDFKTSTQGWNKYQKQDRTKIDQLLLYKRFYSMVFNVPMNHIDVEFFIVKRKLLEDVNFPQSRIQRVPPADGKLSMKEVEQTFADFINDCFTFDGKPNKDKVFIKNPDKGKKNCKYCPFKTLINPKTNEKYCDGKAG